MKFFYKLVTEKVNRLEETQEIWTKIIAAGKQSKSDY